MRIDAHFHVWQLARGDYGWLTPALEPIHRDVSVTDWARQAAAVGVTHGLLVQAAPTEAETRFLLRQAEQHRAVLGVVGWTDLESAGAAAAIATLSEAPLLKGLRPMLHDLPDPHWIAQPSLAPALAAMAAHGLVFDALIRPVHLAVIDGLAHRHPELRIVIDHAAKPDIASGGWQPWADGIARLAERPNVRCKLSGLLTEAGASAAPGSVHRWAHHVLDCFGAQRVIWGSDWPVLELASTYAGWWRETTDLLAGQSGAACVAILGDNARHWYRLTARDNAGAGDTGLDDSAGPGTARPDSHPRSG